MMSSSKFSQALLASNKENDIITIQTYCATNQQRTAILFHTNMVNPEFAGENIHYTQQTNFREAAAVIYEQVEPLLLDKTGKVFFFENGSILYIVKNYNDETHARIYMNVEKRLTQLELWSKKYPIITDTEIIEYFDLPKDSKTLYHRIVKINHLLTLQKQKKEEIDTKQKKNKMTSALRTDQLLNIVSFFKSSDVTPFISHQEIFLVKEFYKPKPVFCEFTISVEKMINQLLPDIDIFKNEWYFRYVTYLFDNNLLKYAMNQRIMQDDNITPTINMNIINLLSNNFLDIINIYNSTYNQRTLVIEIELTDILSSYDDYLTMRQALSNYENIIFAVDGVSSEHVSLINKKLAGAHLIKIIPSKEMERLPPKDKLDTLAQMIEIFGVERCIFSHCTDERLYQLALSSGFIMFQGYYLDMINQSEGYATRNTFM